jgi:hypothetical protein
VLSQIDYLLRMMGRFTGSGVQAACHELVSPVACMCHLIGRFRSAPAACNRAVQQELPMVAVPEVDDDSTHYARTIAHGGYSEGLSTTTGENHERTSQYRGNREREALRTGATSLEAYLRGLTTRLSGSASTGSACISRVAASHSMARNTSNRSRIEKPDLSTLPCSYARAPR